MRSLDLSDIAAYRAGKLLEKRKGDGIPPGVEIEKTLKKGANNAVYLVRCDGQKYALRVPRSDSNTTKVSHATWEFHHTALAARLRAAPALYDAWYCKHATAKQRAGLYLLMDYFPCDFGKALEEHTETLLTHRRAVGAQIAEQLYALASAGMVCYDLKPNNLLFDPETLKARFIDFGRDFCELREFDGSPGCSAPLLEVVAKMAKRDAKLYTKLLYATMVVIFSAVTTKEIEDRRRDLQLHLNDRKRLNVLREEAARLRASMSREAIDMLKDVLRADLVRDNLKHYNGRRNCGTKRTFRLANFVAADPA